MFIAMCDLLIFPVFGWKVRIYRVTMSDSKRPTTFPTEQNRPRLRNPTLPPGNPPRRRRERIPKRAAVRTLLRNGRISRAHRASRLPSPSHRRSSRSSVIQGRAHFRPCLMRIWKIGNRAQWIQPRRVPRTGKRNLY